MCGAHVVPIDGDSRGGQSGKSLRSVSAHFTTPSVCGGTRGQDSAVCIPSMASACTVPFLACARCWHVLRHCGLLPGVQAESDPSRYQVRPGISLSRRASPTMPATLSFPPESFLRMENRAQRYFDELRVLSDRHETASLPERIEVPWKLRTRARICLHCSAWHPLSFSAVTDGSRAALRDSQP